MTIETMFEIYCDGCERPEDNFFDKEPLVDRVSNKSKKDCWDYAKKHGFHRRRGQHFCSSCWGKLIAAERGE